LGAYFFANSCSCGILAPFSGFFGQIIKEMHNGCADKKQDAQNRSFFVHILFDLHKNNACSILDRQY
jgi:hypothetical protein